MPRDADTIPMPATCYSGRAGEYELTVWASEGVGWDWRVDLRGKTVASGSVKTDANGAKQRARVALRSLLAEPKKRRRR